MKAQWFTAFVLVLALSASSVVEADVRPPTQRLSAAMGSGDTRIFTLQGYGAPAPDPAKSLASLRPLQNITAITACEDHTCALTAGGGVKCWGENSYGELGDGTTTDSGTAVDVVELASGVAAIAAGESHTCALTAGGGVATVSSVPLGTLETTASRQQSGGVKCWGDNGYGQVGDGTTTYRTTPVDVVGLASGVAAIAAGGDHTCALTTGGGVKCWGDNSDGQLGDGTTTRSSTPVNVVGLASGVVAIATGGDHTCALTTGGGVKCWGYNRYGQLGDGTTTNRGTPVDVVGLANGVARIGGGYYNTCALTTGGGVKCWGYNVFGELADGTTTQRSAPVDVVGLGTGVTMIATGGYHTCALTAGGGAKCWGWDGWGQLGLGTITYRTTPVDVITLLNQVYLPLVLKGLRTL